jgi:hypothetical protein
LIPYPMLRNNDVQKWPNGVISGGIIIDMLELFSRTGEDYDYKLVLWLQMHYISPFGRIERLDGLVVTKDEDRYVVSSAPECQLS